MNSSQFSSVVEFWSIAAFLSSELPLTLLTKFQATDDQVWLMFESL